MTGNNQKPEGGKPKTSPVEDQLSQLRAAVCVSEHRPSSEKEGVNEVDDRDEIPRRVEARFEKVDRQLANRLTPDDLRLMAEMQDVIEPIIDAFIREWDAFDLTKFHQKRSS